MYFSGRTAINVDITYFTRLMNNERSGYIVKQWPMLANEQIR